jgi:hypothetical protein
MTFLPTDRLSRTPSERKQQNNIKIKLLYKLDEVVHACNHSTSEADIR